MAIQFNTNNSVGGNNGVGGTTPSRDGVRTSTPSGNRSDGARGEVASTAEAVQLSEGAKLLQSVAEGLKSVPEVNEGRVESIRQAIAEGRYHVDPVRLAQRFLELEGEL